MLRTPLALIAAATLIAGCSEKAEENTVAPAETSLANVEEVPANEVPTEGSEDDLPAIADAVSFDGWMGSWRGPEGTSLSLAPGNAADSFTVSITDLDGAKSYPATAKGATISFTRKGVVETLRPASGDETRMKWLAGKGDCLMTKPGEGWCRD